MKLQLFNGGLNTRLAPELIAPNEAVRCTNVDASTGQLKSAKGLKATDIEVAKYPIYFDAADMWVSSNEPRDYVQHSNKLYWTGPGKAKKFDGVVEQQLGIEQPTTAPSTKVTTVLAPPMPTVTAIAHSDDPLAFVTNFDYTGTGEFPANTAFECAMVTYQHGKPIAVGFDTSQVMGNPAFELRYRYTLLGSASTLIPIGSMVKCYRKFAGEWRLDVETSVGSETIDGELVNIWTEVSSVQYDLTDRPIEVIPSAEGVQPGTTKLFGLTSTVAGITSGMVTFNGTALSTPFSAIRMHTNVEHPTWWVNAGGVWIRLGSTQTYDYAVTPDVTEDSIYSGVGVTGEVQYVYTYYNANDGTESQPSLVSKVVTSASSQVSLFLNASNDPQVTHIKVYRVGNSLLKFTEVLEAPNETATHIDTVPDTEASGYILTSSLNGVPREGLRYITQAYNVFFGAYEDKLYFTRDIGNPNYWPETYYIDFHEPITGIGTAANGIVVTTLYKSFVITGTNATTFVKRLLSADQGCVSHESIVTKGNTMMFISTDGICATSGNSVQVLSKHKLGKIDLDVINACVHDEVYYVQLLDKSILALDLRYEQALINYSFNTQKLVVANDTLYGVVQGKLYEMFSGEQVAYSYMTGKLTEGSSSTLKSYNTVYVAADGEHTLAIYADDVKVREINLAGRRIYDVAIPQKFARASTIQFELSGIGIVKEIEYKAIGKTNE